MAGFQKDPIPYDYIVIGLGGHGSAALAALAKEEPSARILGIEQYDIAHGKGSSHGQSRIYRQAYFEDPAYVPLLQRSLELWKELDAFYVERYGSVHERRHEDAHLLKLCGGVMIGQPDSAVVAGTLRSIAEHQLPHRVLSAEEMRGTYPGIVLAEDEIGVCEDAAGFLRPERCIRAHIDLARLHGAETHFGERFLRFESTGEGEGERVRVQTDRASYTCRKLCITVGAWAASHPDLSAQALGLSQPLHVLKKLLFWLKLPREGEVALADSYKDLPVFIWDLGQSGGNFYGFPSLTKRDRLAARLDPEHEKEARATEDEDGDCWELKVAFHQRPTHSAAMMAADSSYRVADPAQLDRSVRRDELRELLRLLRTRFPGLQLSDADGEGEDEEWVAHSEACMYTMTQDEHFLVDFHPQHRHVLVSSPCSGHGFKFCAGLGEALAQLMRTGSSRFDLSLFRLR